uniref:RNA helicase n=1 Tax=Corethron hystrix TaxID=216773 RepID=A0A7S1C0E0_9STRA|mmetsp:Transcript_6456/g.13961  ORF Transcript_6456/g.13961 Transcript_6456/m.13961 type:complete len:595 (+) Transcript_6456:120-1904(+)|eukprot:CAMPEP_0113316318 /NCGR_PEP_ID=MMETSP0010_2-20120614/11638_1 /TAXON_ID=216773 ORGANISM="Corethron hystrix, Strain 308" /NCGR_SAMPLE_ID=MMETSP0010_2 /ASSEMBLY_ACC=CAM_ASM_000155 /LENGTH=594 /DNA_ID=CAMNT_0000173003 /DNA_START=65 /DNA_END=1849 /DNA_ORIENTATION=+ /assembly_acc=CAM_ASM_000155
MGASNTVDDAAIVKAASLILLSEKSNTMKTKALAKAVAKTLGLDREVVLAAIAASSFIAEEGKMASLAPEKKKEKKRKKNNDGDGEDIGGDDDAEKARKRAKKEKKRAKKEAKRKKASASASPHSGPTNDAGSWRKKNSVSLLSPSGEDMTSDPTFFPPSLSFASANLPPALLSHFASKKWPTPTPIQSAAWPVLMAERDVVGIAETGSGKTLAFAIPALLKMVGKKDGRRSGPSMLVLAPTRELAMQSKVAIVDAGEPVGISAVIALYGGVSKHDQIRTLRKGVDVVVATPGRLRDLADGGDIDLSSVQHLVLDEADRMLDMGFEEEVRHIIGLCAPLGRRRTAMFSATWPSSVQAIAMEHMQDPVRIYVGFESIVGSGGTGTGATDDSLSANKRVTQTVEVIEDRAREARLRSLLAKHHTGKNRVLIFALYKKEAARMELTVRRWGHKVGSLHGDKAQDARSRALEAFRDGSCPLLVATDVAARGLDIPNVEVVINYTFPLTIEDYVHRIGRTGRAGKTGMSYTFFQPTDKSHAGELQQVMKQAGQNVPEDLLAFGSTIKKKEHSLYGNFGPQGGITKKSTKIKFDTDDDYE